MKLLIGGSSSKMFHLKEFSDMLNDFNVETKLVFDTEKVISICNLIKMPSMYALMFLK